MLVRRKSPTPDMLIGHQVNLPSFSERTVTIARAQNYSALGSDKGSLLTIQFVSLNKQAFL